MNIDKHEAPPGYIAVEGETPGLCFGCDLYKGVAYDCPRTAGFVSCSGARRNDEREVVFVKTEAASDVT